MSVVAGSTVLASHGGSWVRARAGSGSNVNDGLTARRVRRPVENDDFHAFGRRVIRAAGRRIAAGDIECLPQLTALAAEVEQATADAVAGLRAAGYSWTDIASRLGVTRQGAQQRWG